jgi:hypothetical protein
MINNGFRLEEEIWYKEKIGEKKYDLFKTNSLIVACRKGTFKTIQFVVRRPEITRAHMNF